MEDVVEGFEDRLGGIAEAVFAQPLDVADPDGGLGKLVGVFVDFDAVKLGGADRREEAGAAKLGKGWS